MELGNFGDGTGIKTTPSQNVVFSIKVRPFTSGALFNFGHTAVVERIHRPHAAFFLANGDNTSANTWCHHCSGEWVD
jgi:hypothetical protein